MAPARLLVCALAVVPSLFGQLVAAADKKEDLASEKIDNSQQYSSNFTELKGGWVETGVCAGKYCVYSNRYLAGGRGISLVTTSSNRLNQERTENWLTRASSNWAPREPPFALQDVGDGTMAYVANTTIKRGTNLLGFTPVLLVHKMLFEEVKEAEQDRLLDTAVKLLPWASRQKFNAQKVEKKTGHKVKDIIKARPFEVDMGYQTAPTDEGNEKHFVNYPEAAGFLHNCRPNVAYYIDGHLGHISVAARKIEAGEPLTIAYTDIFSGRAARQAEYRKVHGKVCNCSQCAAGGDLQQLKTSDDRLKEIKRIEEHLKDYTNEHVTGEMIERLIKLYKEEKLQVKLSSPYQLAALNYNYLGHHKEAVKYANLASQAAIVEQGPDSVEALTMRILASDPKGHYSWKQKDKYKGPNVGKRQG